MAEKGEQERNRIRAERVLVTMRSFEEQMRCLELSPRELRGKYILSLGPGSDLDFERKALEQEAALVVPYSYKKINYAADRLTVGSTKLHPVRGLFQELPPGHDIFDLAVSVYGFPRYAYDRKQRDGKIKNQSIKELQERYLALMDLTKEARLFPVDSYEVEAARESAKISGTFTCEVRLYGKITEGAVELHDEALLILYKNNQ